MLKNIRYAVYLTAAFLSMQSCVDNEYDIDNLDKNAMFLMPPIPIGNIDTFKIEVLESGTIPEELQGFPEFTLEGTEIVKEQVIEGLFTEDILDQLFNENATKDVKLDAKVDLKILDEASQVKASMLVHVLDARGRVIEAVKIPNPETLKYGEEQDFSIIFPHEYFSKMKNAQDLKLTIILRAEHINLNNILLDLDDYIYIKNVVLKGAEYHFKF